jgi:hypothetical protein
MRTCYKVLKFIDNRYFSSNCMSTKCDNDFFCQEYFLGYENVPKNSDTEIFVFKSLNEAVDLARYCYLRKNMKHVIFECKCSSLHRTPPSYVFAKDTAKDLWTAIFMSRKHKKKQMSYIRRVKSLVNYDIESYSTKSLFLVKDITNEVL